MDRARTPKGHKEIKDRELFVSSVKEYTSIAYFGVLIQTHIPMDKRNVVHIYTENKFKIT